MSITNIDSNKPVIEKLETSEKDESKATASIKVTVTAKDNETGIPSTGAYKWYLDDEPTPKATTDVNYYTFTDLTRGQRVTHTFKVEVTDNVGNTQTQSTEAIPFPAKANEIVKPENYGDKIEYSANGVDDWKIFYADEEYVYITTSLPLQNSKYPPSTGFQACSKSQYSYGFINKNSLTLSLLNSNNIFVKRWFSKLKSMNESTNASFALGDLYDDSKWRYFRE